MTDLAWLFDKMKECANDSAVVWKDDAVSYLDLLEKISFWRKKLDENDIKAGQVVVIEGDYSPNAIALLLCLIERSVVIVPLTKSVEAHREEFINIAEVQIIISFNESDDDFRFEKRDVSVANSLTKELIKKGGDAGLILFSSGSTGKSKAALHNFSPLLEKFKVPRHQMCALTFLLLDHIGGINTLLYTLSNGGTVVSVQDRNPEVICKAIADHKVQMLPTSPTFLNMLLISKDYENYDLSSLELITYGTEVMPENTLKQIHKAFPNVRLQQTYGMSELGILRSKSKDSDSLWVKVGCAGFETKIVEGMLWVRAKSAMMGYLNAPNPFDKDGWMNTGDMVEVDGEYIKILGRKSEIINVGGQKVYPAEVENVLMQMENIEDAVVYGEKNPIMGNLVAARINLVGEEDLSNLKKRIREFCKDKLASFKMPVRIDITNNKQFSERYKKMRKVKPAN